MPRRAPPGQSPEQLAFLNQGRLPTPKGFHFSLGPETTEGFACSARTPTPISEQQDLECSHGAEY